MKKMISLLSVVMLCSACAVGVDYQEIKSSEKNFCGLANPMRECKNEQEVTEICGLNLPKIDKKFTDVKFFVINKEIAQLDFSFNATKYSFRMAKGKIENLAGYYVDFEVYGSYNLGKMIGQANVEFNTDKEGVIYWFNEEENISYSFSTTQVLNLEDFKITLVNLMNN